MVKKFWSKNQEVLKFVGGVFLVWQAVLLLLAFLAPKVFPFKPDFAYSSSPGLLEPRANFDGVHYLAISQSGYGLYQQAFFPLYPTLIRYLGSFLNISSISSGLLISNVCVLVFLWFFYRLVELDYNRRVAKSSLIFFLAFPASFFLGMVYTESLFLALAIGSFYLARKKKWWLAGLLGGLASYTRVIGIFLLPALLLEWLEQSKNKSFKFKVKSLVPLALIPSGLVYYMRFLWQNYQDPFLFAHVQPHFGAGRSADKLILLYQVFWRYGKMILTTKLDPLYFTVWLELLVAIIFLLLLFFCFKQKMRISYLIFAGLAYLLPSLSGTFSSFPRYVLVMFPCFIVLAKIKNKPLKNLILAVFALIFAVSAIFFFQGYWVS